MCIGRQIQVMMNPQVKEIVANDNLGGKEWNKKISEI